MTIVVAGVFGSLSVLSAQAWGCCFVTPGAHGVGRAAMHGDIRSDDYVLLAVCVGVCLVQLVTTARKGPSRQLTWYVAAALIIVAAMLFVGAPPPGEGSAGREVGSAFVLMWTLVALAWLMIGYFAGHVLWTVRRWSEG